MNFQVMVKMMEKEKDKSEKIEDKEKMEVNEEYEHKKRPKDNNDSVASGSVTSNGKETSAKPSNDSESMDIDANKSTDENTKKEKQTKSSKKERKSSSLRYHSNEHHQIPFGGTERTALQQQQNTTSNQNNNTSTSFLDGLKEEDRRTRTRLLPAVDGFRKLHKSEIKSDLKLARAILHKKKKEDEEDMEEKEEENIVIPKTPFIPPYYEKNENDITSNEVLDDQDASDNEETPKKPKEQSKLPLDPSTIETISAYNPPRPPESIGPKKKHRLLRWERHPNEIEIDLDNYKKTVDKTRYEWRKLINECQNVEGMNGVLRNHFMEHAKNLKRESEVLDEEYGDLMGRIRGVVGDEKEMGMNDLIKHLQSDISSNVSSTISNVKVSGLGGITPLSHSTKQPLGSGWTIPRDKVQTPLGNGIVLDILPISELNPNTPPPSLNTPASTIKSTKEIPPFSHSGILLPSRLCIKLPFGIGYFTPESVQVINQSCKLSNEDLLQRWNFMRNSALNEGIHCDHNSMLRCDSKEEQKCYHYIPQNAHISPFIAANRFENSLQEEKNVSSPMDVDKPNEQKDETNIPKEQQVKDNHLSKNGSRKRSADNISSTSLPLDYNLLPCGSQRGTVLVNLHTKDLQTCLENQFRSCKGIIGTPTNTEIPKNILQAESTRLTQLSLQAQVLQKRNALYRQRKIRLRNERCFSNSIERATKVEKFMIEMKDDYIGLKHRLAKELEELGIDCDKVNSMLKDYYRMKGCEVVSGGD